MVSGSAALPVSDARAVARDHRPHAARALRHDRDRHGALELAHATACPATSASRCRASRCGSSTSGRDVVDGTPGEIQVRGAERVPRVLEPPRRDAGRVRRRLVPHRRRRGARRRRLPASSVARRSTSSRAAAKRSRRSRSRTCCATHPRYRRLRGRRRARRRVGRTRLRRGRAATDDDARLARICASGRKQRHRPDKVPARVLVRRRSLPRNAMGKVTKPDIKRMFKA